MGRKKIKIPIRGVVFKAIVAGSDLKAKELCEKLGVTRQSLHDWISKEEIPPRRLSDVVRLLKLDVKTISGICNREKSLSFWRNKATKLIEENKKFKESLTVLLTHLSEA